MRLSYNSSVVDGSIFKEFKVFTIGKNPYTQMLKNGIMSQKESSMGGLLAPKVEIEIEIKSQEEEGESCPLATQDVEENLKNRQKAIDKANYGPMNPNEPNSEYWRKLANGWRLSPDQAKRSLCGNCAAFIQTESMMDCIEKGMGEPDAWEVIDAGDLGYCELFHFKCASKRTCAAWIVGGPVTEDMEEENGDD